MTAEHSHAPVTHSDLPGDRNARYFEDYPAGMVVECGPIAVDEAEIIAFCPGCRKPTKRIGFGSVIASGWHTASLMMRLLVDHFLPGTAGLASPGIDELRWLAPVRPGDRLSLRITVTDARLSRSKPDRGLVQTFNEVINQDGTPVMTVKAMTLMRCRATTERD